ncbi:MAG TPA: hypothetical protein VMS17_07365 [Gemmataceae bacterium]|nr:hypothetical protein [Gemmataceae bacterium]
MLRQLRGLILPLALAVVLTVAADRGAAQPCAAPPPVYIAPTVAYYAPPTVAYYAPPTAAYYYTPAVSYYAPPVAAVPTPAVSYYAPAAYPAATVTTRYGLFGRPRVTVTQYYAP